MFKVYNLVLYYAIFLSFISACLIAFEVMFGSYLLSSWEYWFIVFRGLLVVAFLSFVLKLTQKWTSAMRIFKLTNSQTALFQTKLSSESNVWGWFFSGIELVFSVLMLYFFIKIYYFPPLIVLLVLMIADTILWKLVSRQINLLILPSAVVYCERQGEIIPISHLKSLEMSFNRLFFITNAGKYSIDAKSIPTGKKQAFLIALKKQISSSTFISDEVKKEFKETLTVV